MRVMSKRQETSSDFLDVYVKVTNTKLYSEFFAIKFKSFV